MEITLQRFRLTIALNSLFYPFSQPETLEIFEKHKYEVTQSPKSIPPGPRNYMKGPIARKNDVIVSLDEDKKFVQLGGFSINDCLNIQEEVCKILDEDFNVNKTEINYVELTSNYLIKTEKNPLKSIQAQIELRNSGQFKEILGFEPSDYKLNLVKKGVSPSSKNWVEISVSPKLTMSNAYFIEVVMRNEEINETKRFARKLSNTIEEIMKLIES